MSESTFRVKIIVDTKDQTSKPAKKAAKGMDAVKVAAKLAAGALVAFKVAQKTVEFVKFGARVDRAATALDNLAQGVGTTGDEIIKSIQEASGFTIDRMSAMEAANKALLLEVVKTPEEFSALTRNAVLLGRAMGEDAATSVDKFTRAAGRQSKLIADDLGLKIDLVKVQEETNRLMEEDATLTEDAAKARGFFNVMMEEATRKTAALGGEQADAATQIEGLTAAWKTLTQQIGEAVAEETAETGLIDKTSEAIRVQTEMLDLLEQASERAGGTRVAMGRGVQAMVAQAIITTRTWQKDEDELRASIEETTSALGDTGGLTAAVEDVDRATIDLGVGTGDFFDVMSEGQSDLAMYEGALGDVTDTLLEQEAAVVAVAAANREAAADFTSFGRDTVKMAEDFAKDEDEIRAEHEKNLADIAKKGWSTRIKFDEAAETERLSRLKERLQVSLQQQSEFSDKTKISQRQSKEFSIANLQEEIATREQRLADFHAGRLVKAGINTAGLVAEEQARFDQELAILDASRIEQERIQRESLGRMLLEHVVTWGQMAGATATEIEAMQLKIAEEYGIITEDGVAAATAQKDTWLENFALIRQVGEEAFTAIENRINLIPKTITVDIVFQERQAAKAAAEAVHGSAVPGMASGGFVAGGAIDVGEEGPERVILPAGSFVNNAAQTSITNNEFKMDVSTRATQPSVMADFEMMRALAN